MTQQDVIGSAEPHNAVAEQAVLGAVLADNSVYDRLAGILRPEDFYEPLHGDLFKAVADLINDGRRADLVTLAPIIKGRTIGEADAASYVYALPDMAPAKQEQLWDYAQEIARYAAQRAILQASRDLAQGASKIGADLINTTTRAIERIDRALDRTRAQEETAKPAGAFGHDAIAAYSAEGQSLSTGLRSIDDITGGLFLQELSIIGGRPGMGKSSFATTLAYNIASAGHGVYYLSLEMAGIPLAQRILSSMCYVSPTNAIPYEKFRKRQLQPSEIAALETAARNLERLPFIIETKAGLNLLQIKASIRKAQAEIEARGKKLRFIVVDYLGLVEPSSQWRDNRVQQLAELTKGFRELAKAMNAHVCLLVQLNREVEKREDKRPQLHDLRESGAIEQDADLVMLCYRQEYYVEREGEYQDPVKEDDRKQRLDACKNKLEIIIPKQRMGEVGVRTLFCSVANNRIDELTF